MPVMPLEFGWRGLRRRSIGGRERGQSRQRKSEDPNDAQRVKVESEAFDRFERLVALQLEKS